MKISPILLALLVSSNALAAMYKWVDENGEVHYTQTPPPGDIQAETIKPPPDVNTEKAREELQQRQELVEKIREQRQEENQKEKLAQQELEKKRANCDMAKKRLDSYDQPRVRFVQPDGSRRYATEEERQAQIQKSKEMIKEFCN